MRNKDDIDLIFESYNQRILEESEVDYDALFLKKHDRLPESKEEVDDFKASLEATENDEDENSQGDVVYIVQSNAEYEDTDTHGIFTEFETAKKHAAEVELVPGFSVGIMEVPLNVPDAVGKYHRLP